MGCKVVGLGVPSRGRSKQKQPSNPKNLLGGSLDLVATYDWAHNPTYSLSNWPCVGCQSCKYGHKPSCK